MTISPFAAREGTSAPQWPIVNKCCRHLVPSSDFFVQSYALPICGNFWVSSKTKRRGEEGAAGYCPKIVLPKKGHFMVLCPFHRSHREICTRNRPVSETKFLDDFWGPLSLPAPLSYCWLGHPRARDTCGTLPRYTILCYTILYYTISLYYILYTTLCEIMLYKTILCRTMPYATIIYPNIQCCTILYYTILYYTILYYTRLYYTRLYFTTLQRYPPLRYYLKRVLRDMGGYLALGRFQKGKDTPFQHSEGAKRH